MNNTAPTTEEIESEKVLEKEVDTLQNDLNDLGDKLDKEEISIEDFQAEANKTLAKHTFKDFLEFFNNSYKKVKLTMENQEAFVSKQKVFIGNGSLTGKERRRRAKTEEIKIRAALRQMANILDAYELKKLTNAYVAERCAEHRNDESAITAAKKWFNSALGKDISNVNNAETLQSVKFANLDSLDTLGTHLILAAKALSKTEGTYDVAPMCLQLTKNANAVQASMMAARAMKEEELKKLDFTALEVFSNALKDFNSVVESQIKELGIA